MLKNHNGPAKRFANASFQVRLHRYRAMCGASPFRDAPQSLSATDAQN